MATSVQSEPLRFSLSSPSAHVHLKLIWISLDRTSLHWGANLSLDPSQKASEDKVSLRSLQHPCHCL